MTTRKVERFTFMEDDWGRISVRNGRNQTVSLVELQSWVDRYAQNPVSKRVVSELEQALLAKHNTKFNSGGKRGYVYVVRRPNGHVKIGQTCRLKDRIKSLRDTTEGGVELLHVVLCANRSAIEKVLHSMFKDKHIDGEWFALTQEDLDIIRAREVA